MMTKAVCSVLADVAQRQGDADKSHRRMPDRHGDVQHVDVERVAEALRRVRGPSARASATSGRWP